MSLLSRLFGSKNSESPVKPTTSVDYQGFRITPTPVTEDQGYRLSALIEKEVDGTLRTHKLIRADTMNSPEQCADAAIAKAKQLIDQQGDRLF